MTPKQNWLLKRLLVPAGILPPAISYQDLAKNEESRTRSKASGIEYFFILDQDAKQINSSSIGGKTFAVHAPWPVFPHGSVKGKFAQKVVEALVFKDKLLPKHFSLMAERTYEFAKDISAKVITFHISFFDHRNLPEELNWLAKLEKKYSITAAIEAEGPYIFHHTYNRHRLREFGGNHDWIVNPVKLVKALDQVYPAKKFGICFDTASLNGLDLGLVETAKPIMNRIVHVHLAESHPGVDLALEISHQQTADFAAFLYSQNYQGYITAEVNGTVGETEKLIAQIYGASSVLKIPLFKTRAFSAAQTHIEHSCRFLLDHI